MSWISIPTMVDRLPIMILLAQIGWDDNEDFYRAWEEARTGYPWIDAIMTQLREQGVPLSIVMVLRSMQGQGNIVAMQMWCLADKD